MKLSLLALLLSFVYAVGAVSSPEKYVGKLASLIDKAKLATLGERGANPRVQKAVAILADAERDKLDVGKVCVEAVKLMKTKPAAGELTQAALLRNLDIARKLGCLDPYGLDDMRHGKAARIRKGPNKDGQHSVDHIIPRGVVPELDNVIANLELMPLRMKESKKAKVGERQLALAEPSKRPGGTFRQHNSRQFQNSS